MIHACRHCQRAERQRGKERSHHIWKNHRTAQTENNWVTFSFIWCWEGGRRERMDGRDVEKREVEGRSAWDGDTLLFLEWFQIKISPRFTMCAGTWIIKSRRWSRPTANPTFSFAAGRLPAAYARRRGRCKGRVVVTNCPAWIHPSRLLSRYQNETIIRGRRPILGISFLCGRSFATYRALKRETPQYSRRFGVSSFKRAWRRDFRYANDNILKHVYSGYRTSSPCLSPQSKFEKKNKVLEFSILNAPDLSFNSLFNIIKRILLV